MSMVKNKPVSLDIQKDEWSLDNIKALFSCKGCTGYQKSTIQASIISEQESGELSEGEVPTPTKNVIVPEKKKHELDFQFVVPIDNSPKLESPIRNLKLNHARTRGNEIDKPGIWGFFQTFTVDNSHQAPEEKKESNVIRASLELDKIATFEKKIDAPET